MYFLLSFALFAASIAASLIYGFSMAYAMLLGYFMLSAAALSRGCRVSTVLRASALGIKDALLVIEILLLIGALTAAWRMSGVIAFFVYYGVGFITPKLFIIVAFLLTCIISYALGTSVGVAGTAGVILMAIARSGGVNELLAAGAILSGVYFGDRCSPTASSANLVAALTKTDLYQNVKRMLASALLPTLLCILIYCALSFMNPLAVSHSGYMQDIKEDFTISLWAFLPVSVMFVFPLMKIKVKYALAVSSVSACAIAFYVQGLPLSYIVKSAVFGYYPQNAVMGDIWNGGGLSSMVSIICILSISSTYSKILSVSGLLHRLNEIIDAMTMRVGESLTIIISSFFTSGIFCSQISSCIMTAALLKRSYSKHGHSREDFALDIENSLVTIAPMVPWCLSCSVPLKLLGVGAEAIKWDFYIFLLPIVYFMGKELRSRRGVTYRHIVKRRITRIMPSWCR